jgi:hypothetical protein
VRLAHLEEMQVQTEQIQADQARLIADQKAERDQLRGQLERTEAARAQLAGDLTATQAATSRRSRRVGEPAGAGHRHCR